MWSGGARGLLNENIGNRGAGESCRGRRKRSIRSVASNKEPLGTAALGMIWQLEAVISEPAKVAASRCAFEAERSFGDRSLATGTADLRASER